MIAAPAPASALGAGDRLRIGFIGPGGRGFGAHVKTLAKLRSEGANIDLVAVSEVYKVQEDMVCDYIEKETGLKPKRYEDYRDMDEKFMTQDTFYFYKVLRKFSNELTQTFSKKPIDITFHNITYSIEIEDR